MSKMNMLNFFIKINKNKIFKIKLHKQISVNQLKVIHLNTIFLNYLKIYRKHFDVYTYFQRISDRFF
jgi:hypothetical protein